MKHFYTFSLTGSNYSALFGDHKRNSKLNPHPASKVGTRSSVNRRDYGTVPVFDTKRAKEMVLEAHSEETKSRTRSQYDEEYREYAAKVRNCHPFNDPASPFLWQYLNDGTSVSPFIGLDINVYPAYVDGLTGLGSKVAVVDDEIDTEHWDLRENYDLSISLVLPDTRTFGSSVTMPGVAKQTDSHGTWCAGIIAATANNGICSHGIAYEARIGLIPESRIIGDKANETLDTAGLSFIRQKVDIYSASWGPADDGIKMDYPHAHAKKLFDEIFNSGRNGLGSLFLFASGNGGGNGDNCGADGFASSPEMITVGALDELGNKAFYSESCAAVRVSVPVGGTPGSVTQNRDLFPTLDENNQCFYTFCGTSAAAPLAAGCLALVLQAKPDLTVRDVENLLPWSTRVPSPTTTGWLVNAAGILYSTEVGYGLLDCFLMTQLAKFWVRVGRLCKLKIATGYHQRKDWIALQASVPGEIIDTTEDANEFIRKTIATNPRLGLIIVGSPLKVILDIDSTTGAIDSADGGKRVCGIEVTEKVVVKLQWKHICRGAISVRLTSPSGTSAIMLYYRANDSYAGNGAMEATSVAQWGEIIAGRWRMEIRSDGSCNNPVVSIMHTPVRGILFSAQLEFWGTKKKDSGSVRNALLLRPLLTDLGREAIKCGTGHILSRKEVANTFYSQRQKALARAVELVKDKCP